MAAGDVLLTELTDSESVAAADGLATETDCPEPGAARLDGNRRLVLRCVLTGATLAASAAMLALAARGAERTRPAEAPVQRQTGLSILQLGTTCANFDSIVRSLEHADDLDECEARCAADSDCDGVLWQKHSDESGDNCALYQGKCEQAESASWERVDLTGADSHFVTGWGKGCTNWESISLGEASLERSAADCAKRCGEYPNCRGFGYQHHAVGSESEHASDWGLGAGTCKLWKGPCQQGDDEAWNDHTMTARTPANYTMLGASTFCRNYFQIVLMHTPERQVDEFACSMQCWLHREHCVGFAYKEEESCDSNEKVEGTASCILFQGECVPEPDTCWRTFRMTGAPAPNLTNVPQSLPYGAPLQVTANMEGKRPCTSEWEDFEIAPPSYAVAPTYTLEECTNLCYITGGCQAVSHSGSDHSCLLLDELCEELIGVTGELRLESASDVDRVAAAVATALAALDIPDASVKVSEGDAAGRRLAPAELSAGRRLGSTPVWSAEWTFMAPGSTIYKQSAAAAKVRAAAKKWVADGAEFAWVLRQTLPGVDAESLAFAAPESIPWRELDLYELGWPTTPLTTSRQPGNGCANWETIGLGHHHAEVGMSRGTCALLCEGTIGCVGFDYQFRKCASTESMAKGECLLLGGACEVETNECWDKYDRVTEPLVFDFSKTIPRPSSEATTIPEVKNGHKKGTTITITTTKMLATEHLVFLNEILYRSDNPDVPGVEIAGPNGTDLQGYRVVVYSQAGDVEQTVELSGTIYADNQQDYGVVWQGLSCQRFTAVALARGDLEVISFLSVLDPVTAAVAPAKGLTSTVIKDEHGEPLQCAHDAQMSLQLRGAGLSYSAFEWKVHSASPGQVNVLQNFGSQGG